MAHTRGKNGTVRISSSGAVGEMQNYELNMSAEVIKTTALLDTWDSNVQGIRSWSGSLTCWFDEDDSIQDMLRDELESSSADGSIQALRFEVNYGSTTNGYYEGNAQLSNIRISNPGVSGIIEMSCDFVGDGGLTYTAAV